MTDDEDGPGGRRPRVPRSDRLSNHAAILDAAEARFVLDGIDVSLRAVAADAGVGIATLYRHFPNRHALVAAVFARVGESIESEVGTALRSEGTGWQRITRGLDVIVSLVIAHPALYLTRDWLLRHDPGFRGAPSWAGEVIAAVALAHEEGTVRPDVAASDIAMIPFLLAPISSFPEPARSLVAGRQLALLLRGIRRDADTVVLPGAPLTHAALTELADLAARGRNAPAP